MGLPARFPVGRAASIPVERQIRGLYGARLWEREVSASIEFLTSVLGFQRIGAENGWTRFGFADAPGHPRSARNS